jgi:serine-type D-Ala-D-Ala carboxypeptidase/endopeptidase (penicillin-binding protein 4)
MKKIIRNWELGIRNWVIFCLNCKFYGSLMLSFLSISITISTYAQQKQIGKLASAFLFNDSAISTGHIGISIYEPASNKYWYNYNESHYFIPASNTKLFSLYAGMKYLGDSLVGARYFRHGNTLFVKATGDPTFLHPDYEYQPLFYLLKNIEGEINIDAVSNAINKFGKGWAYDDYNYSYMVERNKFPIYGNAVWLSEQPIYPKKINKDTLMDVQNLGINYSYWVKPKYFAADVRTSANNLQNIKVTRDILINRFLIEDDYKNGEPLKTTLTPFNTNYGKTALEILSNILSKEIKGGGVHGFKENDTTLHSQPSDSLFKPMMHNSDNFFAEQTLLMASNEHLGYMSDEKIIDTILKSALKDIPQKPKWVDGSGLSRYNLFTPQSFVYLLNKMKNEFGLERLKNILPTGGEGTLSSYYKKDAGFIFAKTGTLSNNCALSGYLITSKGKLLIFSVLVNNYITNATPVRKAVEQFLQSIREKY